MSLALLAGILVAGVAISNERALFDASGDFDQVAAAATIKALAAVVHPARPWQAGDVSRLVPIRRASQVTAPANPAPVAFSAIVPPSDRVLPASVTPAGAPGGAATPRFTSSFPTGDVPGIGPVVGDTPQDNPGDPGSPGGPGDPNNPNNPPGGPGDDPGNPSAVPEPATWAMLILGFGCIGGVLRLTSRRRGRSVSRAG